MSEKFHSGSYICLKNNVNIEKMLEGFLITDNISSPVTMKDDKIRIQLMKTMTRDDILRSKLVYILKNFIITENIYKIK